MITFTDTFTLGNTEIEIEIMKKACEAFGWNWFKIKIDTEGNPIPILEDVLDEEGNIIGKKTVWTETEEETWEEFYTNIRKEQNRLFIEHATKFNEEQLGKLNYNATERAAQMMGAITYNTTIE